MSIDAYKIAVKIALVENVTMGLASLSRYFMATNRNAEELQTRLNGIRKMALLGSGALAAGGFGLKALQGPLEEAKKYQIEMAKLQAQGVGDVALAQADKYAKAQKIMGASATDTLKMLAESQSVLRDFEHAKEVTPLLLRMKFGIESVMTQGGYGGGHGEKAGRMFTDALKVTELRGALNDPISGKFSAERFHQTLDLMTKAYTASGGLVKPSDYLAMVKTGGVSAKGLSNSGFFFGMMHMLQESGGSRVGTSLMSGYQNWVMGRTSQQVAEEMAKSGLIDQSQIKYGKNGHLAKVQPGALEQAQLFRENPFEYLEKVVLPQARAKGVKDGQDMANYLDRLYSNRTWGNLLNTMYRERTNIHKHMSAGAHAAGIDEAARIGAGGLPGQEIDYEAKMANLKLVLGEKILPLVIVGIEKLNSTLERLTAFAREWPTLTKGLVIGFAALSGLAVAAGGILLFASAFSALAVVWKFTRLGAVFRFLMSGIGSGFRIAGQALAHAWPIIRLALTGVGRGLVLLGRVFMVVGRSLLLNPVGLVLTGIAVAAFLLWKHWDSIKPRLLAMWDGAKALFNGVIDTWHSVSSFVADGLSGVYNAITGWLQKIMEWVSGKIKGVGGWFKDKGAATWDGAKTLGNDVREWFAGGNGNSPYVAPQGASQTVQVNSTIHVDGRAVATAVTMHQAREAARPGMGAPGFDPSMSAMPVGMGYSF